MTNLRVAHESTDDTVPAHCPWDGSGQIIANPDGSIHCEYCQRNFTLKIQPQFPAMPQEPEQRNMGDPDNPEGLSDGTEPDDEGEVGPEEGPEPQDPGDMGDDTGEQLSTPETADQGPAAGSGLAPDDPRRMYSTHTGALLDEEAYLDHLAIAFATDRQAVIDQIKARRRAARRG